MEKKIAEESGVEIRVFVVQTFPNIETIPQLNNSSTELYQFPSLDLKIRIQCTTLAKLDRNLSGYYGIKTITSKLVFQESEYTFS